MPAVEARVTAKENGTETPAAGAAGIVRAVGAAPAREARVPENTVVAPEVMTMFIFAQRSAAVPFSVPELVWVHVAPGVRVKVVAATLPMFLIVMGVVTVLPGVMVVLPPNLLIVEQVAALVETEPPSVLRQVTVAPAFCSCMTSAPVAAVFCVFWMLATKPDMVPVRLSERSTAPSTPAPRATGAKRRRLFFGADA